MTSLEQEQESKGAESVSDYDDHWETMTDNWGDMEVNKTNVWLFKFYVSIKMR